MSILPSVFFLIPHMSRYVYVYGTLSVITLRNNLNPLFRRRVHPVL